MTIEVKILVINTDTKYITPVYAAEGETKSEAKREAKKVIDKAVEEAKNEIY